MNSASTTLKTIKQLLLILLYSSIFFSCKKQNDVPAGITTGNPTSYILKKQTWSGPATNGQSFVYSYSSNHLVSKIERYQWGTMSENGGPVHIWHDTTSETFEYNGNLCTKWIVNAGPYYTFDYNEHGQVSKRSFYQPDNKVYATSFYKYDALGNLVERTDSSQQVDFKYLLNYNADNNLTEVTCEILWSTPQQKAKYEILSFDDKTNFTKAINGLPPVCMFDNNYHAYSSTAPNNFVDVKYYGPVNMEQPFSSPSSSYYTYQYNEEGLPLTMQYGEWVVTFEYEKYK